MDRAAAVPSKIVLPFTEQSWVAVRKFGRTGKKRFTGIFVRSLQSVFRRVLGWSWNAVGTPPTLGMRQTILQQREGVRESVASIWLRAERM